MWTLLATWALMNEPIFFYSTNRHAPLATLAAALLQGQAPDRGLYLPTTYPALAADELAALAGRPYADVAAAVLRRFCAGVFDDATLERLCRDAYDYPVPLEPVVDRCHLLRLDQGPTASFKDFAARMMARWMGVLMADRGSELVILTATSGDTGSAVAHAYAGVPNVRVVVLFPPDEVSDRQRRQMTTIGGNVTTVAVAGQFDDCQALVKQAFADPELVDLHLTSANSINIGRLLPQCVYYVYAYVQLADVAAAEPIIFSVPSGNFGDMMGAVFAKRIGVPIDRIVVATNANDEVPRFLETQQYEPIRPSRVCLSNAMNVGHPSNLARLVDIYGGWLDETGTLHQAPDFRALRRDLFAVSISDEQTRAAIRAAHTGHGAVLEPHGAVGWAGLRRYLETVATPADRLAVSVETAHPAKFPEEVRAATGVDPAVPPSLAGLEERPEHCEQLPADYAALRELLRARFAPTAG
jgi:threonine synthase